MDRVNTALRVLVAIGLFSWSILRIVRYFRHGVAKRVTALPPSGGLGLPNTPVTADATSSSGNGSSTGAASFLAGLTVAGVWIGANAVLWFILLGLPMLTGVPLIWRLFAGVFANFYLFPFARALGEKQKQRMQAKAE